MTYITGTNNNVSRVNIGPGNDLLPYGTKPLPEPMLTYHRYGPLAFFRGNYYEMI